MILLVSYDFTAQSIHLQEAFVERLKEQGEWCHCLRNTWLIDTEKAPNELFAALKENLSAVDRVLVTEIGEYWGTLQPDAWKWIDERLRQKATAS